MRPARVAVLQPVTTLAPPRQGSQPATNSVNVPQGQPPQLDLSFKATDIPQCSRRGDEAAYLITKMTKRRLNRIHFPLPFYSYKHAYRLQRTLGRPLTSGRPLQIYIFNIYHFFFHFMIKDIKFAELIFLTPIICPRQTRNTPLRGLGAPDQICGPVNSDESEMRKQDLEAMDFDELWLLHEELTRILAEKISAEKHKLERRLAQLSRAEPVEETTKPPDERSVDRPRRKYPKVLPKYFNPSAPTETWSGRGKQPRWLVAALRSGQKLDNLLIRDPKDATGNKTRRERQS